MKRFLFLVVAFVVCLQTVQALPMWQNWVQISNGGLTLKFRTMTDLVNGAKAPFEISIAASSQIAGVDYADVYVYAGGVQRWTAHQSFGSTGIPAGFAYTYSQMTTTTVVSGTFQGSTGSTMLYARIVLHRPLPLQSTTIETAEQTVNLQTADEDDPNETFFLARDLTGLSGFRTNRVCTDDDFYRVTLNSPNDSLRASVTYVAFKGDVRLYLYNAQHTLIDSTSGSGTSGIVGASKLAPGVYYLKAAPINGSKNFYDLTYQIATTAVMISFETSPAGLVYTVDGQSYSGQQSLQWFPGAKHTIGIVALQSAGTGTRYDWRSWSDGGLAAHTVTGPSIATTFRATFSTQYYLTINAGSGGTATPQSGWHDGSQQVQIEAIPSNGYMFGQWTGSGAGAFSGTDNPALAVMYGPITESASFTPLRKTTITTDPLGMGFMVDGKLYSASQEFLWGVGTSHSIGTVEPPMVPYINYMYKGWTDGGLPTHTIVIENVERTYRADYSTLYYLTVNSASGGTTSPPSGYFFKDTKVNIQASPNNGFAFAGWTGNGTGSYSGTNASATVTMSGPITQTPGFAAPGKFSVDTDPAGLTFKVDGKSYTTAQLFEWTAGSTHTIFASGQQSGGNGTRYVFAKWSDGKDTSHVVIAAASGGSFIAAYARQYYLTTNTSPRGTVSPQSGWYAENASVSIAAVPNLPSAIFQGWTGAGPGSYTGSSRTATVSMGGAISQTATWVVSNAYTVSTDPPGLSFTVDGQKYSSSTTFEWVEGTSHTVGTATIQGSTTDSRYAWKQWSDGQDSMHTVVALSGGGTLVAAFSKQHSVSILTQCNPRPSITPQSGWFDAGQQIAIQASSGREGVYIFTAWNGRGLGSYSGRDTLATITVDGPIIEEAIYMAYGYVSSIPPGISFYGGDNFGRIVLVRDFGLSVDPAEIPHTPNSSGDGKQYQFKSVGFMAGFWDRRIISAPFLISVYFDSAYYLAVQAGEGGTVSPNEGKWYHLGDKPTIQAVPRSGYTFTGWTGSGDGSYTGSINPATITIQGPIVQTAKFELLPTSKVAAPQITPTSQTFSAPFQASLSCATDGANIRYTLDGTDPTTSAQPYTVPLTISGLTQKTLKAKAWKTGFAESDVATAIYTYDVSSAAVAIPITISDGSGASQELSFGLDPSATDGIDESLGEVEQPPFPPTGVLDARFVGDDIGVALGQGLRKDYRPGSMNLSGTRPYEIKYQVGSGSGITITWNFLNTPLPVTGTLQDVVTGSIVNVPMTGHGSYTVTNPGAISKLRMNITYGTPGKDVAVSSGWNVVSVPFQTNDMSVRSLFLEASSAAFGFDNGYVQAAALSPGKGYWLKFNTGSTYTVSGTPLRPASIAVNAGWNIIGAFDFDVATSSIGSLPSGIVSSAFFAYNNGYAPATTLTAGKGYWVKASQAGLLPCKLRSRKWWRCRVCPQLNFPPAGSQSSFRMRKDSVELCIYLTKKEALNFPLFRRKGSSMFDLPATQTAK